MGGLGGDTSNCPHVAAWMELAAGVTLDPARGDLLNHAAGCPSCARRLRDALAVMSPVPSEAEETAVGALASAQPQWQKWHASSLARAAKTQPSWPKPARVFGIPRWLVAAAGLLLAAGGTFWLWTESRPPLTLLARAYTGQRTFELRIPGAAYAPMRVQRGAALAMSPDLLHSEEAIQRHLQSSPAGAGWLRAEGRAALLEWRSAEAITALHRALDADPQMNAPARAETLTDLATANFQRGERDGATEPYAAAADLLTQAIAIDPSLATAWYNRAIVRQRLGRFADASSDWRRYLQLDPSGPWSDDARARLAALDRRLP